MIVEARNWSDVRKSHESRNAGGLQKLENTFALSVSWTLLMAQMIKNPRVRQETWVQSLGWEDPLKGMDTHSSILAWRIPWTEDLAGYSPWSCKELDMTEHAHVHTHTNTHRRCDSRSKNLESCEEGSWVKECRWSPETGKYILPLVSPEETKPADTLALVQWNGFTISDL